MKILEKLMKELDKLQEQLKLNEDIVKETVYDTDKHIEGLELRIKELREEKQRDTAFITPSIEEIKEQIADIKLDIFDLWDTEKKTIICGDLTLKFRTTYKTNVINDAALLEDIISRTSVKEAANKYISGFKLISLKAFNLTFKLS